MITLQPWGLRCRYISLPPATWSNVDKCAILKSCLGVGKETVSTVSYLTFFFGEWSDFVNEFIDVEFPGRARIDLTMWVLTCCTEMMQWGMNRKENG